MNDNSKIIIIFGAIAIVTLLLFAAVDVYNAPQVGF